MKCMTLMVIPPTVSVRLKRKRSQRLTSFGIRHGKDVSVEGFSFLFPDEALARWHEGFFSFPLVPPILINYFLNEMKEVIC